MTTRPVIRVKGSICHCVITAVESDTPLTAQEKGSNTQHRTSQHGTVHDGFRVLCWVPRFVLRIHTETFPQTENQIIISFY